MEPPQPDQLAEARAACRQNLVKQIMTDNRLAFSFGLRLAVSTEMPLIAKKAGYSAVLINLEHTAIGLETVRDVAVACLTAEITPLVVVPTCATEWISRCLDAGVQGIIVPHVSNVQQAEMCVQASKYPPMGHRSVTMATPQMQYRTNLSRSSVAIVANQETLIMPMIETVEGLENVEAIAAVPGLDVLFIGCGDLSMELGIPGEYDSKIFTDAIEKIAQAAETVSVNGKKLFVGLGGLEGRKDLLERFANKYSSVRFAMAGRDLSILLSGMEHQALAMNNISNTLT